MDPTTTRHPANTLSMLLVELNEAAQAELQALPNTGITRVSLLSTTAKLNVHIRMGLSIPLVEGEPPRIEELQRHLEQCAASWLAGHEVACGLRSAEPLTASAKQVLANWPAPGEKIEGFISSRGTGRAQ